LCPVHPGYEIPKGTLTEILKQAGITRENIEIYFSWSDFLFHQLNKLIIRNRELNQYNDTNSKNNPDKTLKIITPYPVAILFFLCQTYKYSS
jgi:hypothetical protein